MKREPDIAAGLSNAQEVTGAGVKLKEMIERIENLDVERAEVAEQIREVYAEAKANGFDVKIMRKVISRRKRDSAEVAEEEALLELYLNVLGLR